MSKAETTRSYILQKSFDLIYQNGYQATSIDDIIATTRVTKGAFYYHFKNKEEMGLAVIKEFISHNMTAFATSHLKNPGDVRTNIYKMMEALLLKNDLFKVEYGCPAVNLIEEMSAHNASFHKSLKRLMVGWQSEIESALTAAQERGEMTKAHDPKLVAQYINANYAGVRYLGKVHGKSAYKTFLHEFKKYLNSLN